MSKIGTTGGPVDVVVGSVAWAEATQFLSSLEPVLRYTTAAGGTGYVRMNAVVYVEADEGAPLTIEAPRRHIPRDAAAEATADTANTFVNTEHGALGSTARW